MYGVEEAPVEVGECRRHVPRVHAQEPHGPLAQLRTLRQGRLGEKGGGSGLRVYKDTEEKY